jgi:hypothetical protein
VVGLSSPLQKTRKPRLMAQMLIGDTFESITGILEFSIKIGKIFLTVFSPL